MIRFFYHAWQNDKFLFLLLSIFLLLVALPLLPQVWYMTIIFEIVLNIIFITSVFASQETQRYKRTAVTLVILAILLGWLGRMCDTLEYQTAARLLVFPDLLFQLIFLGFMIYTILKVILSTSKVTLHMINGALCVYLLIGLFFSRLYSIIIAYSDSFARYGVPLQGQDGISDTLALLYYSFVTLTTLGYGDITPISPFACMISAIEAITGQLYLAVIVARMVALYVMHPNPPRNS